MRKKLFEIAPNPHHLSQMFGLYRIWGHPEIDVIGGIYAIRKLSCKTKAIDVRYALKVTNKFKEMFSINYRRKNGRWPNLNVSELAEDNFLRKTIESNAPLEIRNPQYSQSLWSKVKGEKTFQCEDTYNLSEVINDKALSLNKAELIRQIKKYQNIGRPSERRVLIKWLESDLISAKDLLGHIDKKGLSEDDLLIGMSGKEREMKAKPRMFALMTIMLGMYFVVTESMLAADLVPLFPQITMIDGLLTILSSLPLICQLLSVQKGTWQQ